MKRLLWILLGALVLTASGCAEPVGGGLLQIGASQLPFAFTAEPQSFSIDGHSFESSGVYRNDDNDFIFSKNGGYIKTIGGKPDALMRFTVPQCRGSVIVYACDAQGNTLSPAVQINPSKTLDTGEVCYDISGYENVRIEYLVPPGERSPDDCNIGKITFWC